MSQEELFSYCCLYLEDVLTYEESRSMGIDGFHKYVKEHVIPIPKSELVVGQTYPGDISLGLNMRQPSTTLKTMTTLV